LATRICSFFINLELGVRARRTPALERKPNRLVSLDHVRGFALIFFLGILSGLNAAGLAEVTAQPPSLSIKHTPLDQYTIGATAEIRAMIVGEAEGANFYYRQPGISVFQVKPMTRAEAGAFVLNFDTSPLTSPNFEYYLEAWAGEIKAQSPPGAPQQWLVASGQGEAPPAVPQNIPTPQAEEAKFRLPINLTASGLGMLSHNMNRPAAAESNASGNLQAAVQVQPGSRWGVSLDATAAYASVPLPGYKPVSLANLMITFTGGAHSLKAGDLNFNESEYTVFGLGRRGFDYAFDNQKLYVRAFTASTQQVAGFAGLGFPERQAILYGGAAGYKLFSDALGLKAVYVAGKDNPRQGLNVGVPSAFTPRMGDVAALIEETHLFKQSLNLRAEFASSRYDGDLGDESGRATDMAYQVAGDVRVGGLTAGARYRYIGRDFNSVGLAYLANDQKGWESSLSFITGVISLQGMYSREQDNVKNDPNRATTKSQNSQIACTLNLSSKLTLNGGYRRNDQASFLGGLAAQLQDGLTNEVSGGASWMPSPSASMNGTVVDSKITSKNNPGLNTQALTVNAGGCFRAGEVFIVSPSVSWSRSVFPSLGTTAYSGNGNLTLELWLMRQVFSLAFYGTGSRADTPGAGLSRMLDLTAALSFQLGNLIKFRTITLALRGNYNRQDLAGKKITDTRVYLQGDLALSP